jgi:hypothetical protein
MVYEWFDLKMTQTVFFSKPMVMLCQWFGIKTTGMVCQWFDFKTTGTVSLQFGPQNQLRRFVSGSTSKLLE